jgi:chromosomal replication initiation ATPase DnaA
MIPELREHPGFRTIALAVAVNFGLRVDSLFSPRRTEPLATARFAAAYLARKHLRKSHREIAEAFGRSGQNWAILACKTTEDRIETEPDLRTAIETLDREITAKRGPLFKAA